MAENSLRLADFHCLLALNLLAWRKWKSQYIFSFKFYAYCVIGWKRTLSWKTWFTFGNWNTMWHINIAITRGAGYSCSSYRWSLFLMKVSFQLNWYFSSKRVKEEQWEGFCLFVLFLRNFPLWDYWNKGHNNKDMKLDFSWWVILNIKYIQIRLLSLRRYRKKYIFC